MREIPYTGRQYSNGLNSLQAEIEHDQVVCKRGTPSMPKLEFMNGTKWGKDPGDDDPAWPGQA